MIPEEELTLFKILRPNLKVVFDVGCREDSYKDIHPNCVYHLFEPNPDCVIKERPNVIINRFGLWDVTMVLPYYKHSQSFIINKQVVGKDKTRMLPVMTLDEYAKDIPHIDFLKIDTEGGDIHVLHGGTETLKRTDYIQFEYWDSSYKFTFSLPDFDLYLMVEKVLRERYYKKTRKSLPSLLPLNMDVIKLIDDWFIPNGLGGNILGVRKI